MLARLQQFDPPGVFARSLKECLALQLRDRDRLDPAMAALLDHLDLLAQADFPALIKVCGVLPDDLPEMIAELKALNPKPGLAFAPRSDRGGGARHLRAADPGRRLARRAQQPPPCRGSWSTRAYYTELARQHRRQARHASTSASASSRPTGWSRRSTSAPGRCCRVAEAVVARQLPFLQHGVQHLRPLVLRDIADATELHESTVSRATADKYVATPRGNFPFRYFFSNALPGTNGEASHCGRGDPPAGEDDDRARGSGARAVGRSDRRGAARRRASRSRAGRSPSIANRWRIPSSVERRRSQGIKACVTPRLGSSSPRSAVTRRAPEDVPEAVVPVGARAGDWTAGPAALEGQVGAHDARSAERGRRRLVAGHRRQRVPRDLGAEAESSDSVVAWSRLADIIAPDGIVLDLRAAAASARC